MRIVINAYQYSSSITGTDRMAYNFLRELQAIDTVNEYFIICSSEQYIPSVITRPNFRVIKPRHLIPHPFAKRLLNKLWREMLTARILALRADVYFSFHNMQLPGIRVAKRMIASNLDLIPLVLDEYQDLVPRQIKDIQRTAKKADAFMSISEFSKNELHTLLGVTLDSIKVIHLAADQTLSESSNKSLNLPRNFIFTIGGSEPRKNVITVAKAFSSLPENIQRSTPLFIVGGEWHGRSVEPLILSPHIKVLGYVDDATLGYMYREAKAFIFASTYEGFGFTVLEAMSGGTPVICASGTSLNEVAGDATVYFSPDSVHELKRKMNELLESPGLQKKLSAKGRQQAQKFSWKKSAESLCQLLTVNK